MPGPINMVKDGTTVTVPEDQIAGALDQGWKPETPTEHAADVAAKVQTEQFGGPVGKVAAVGTGALRTVTGGLSDVALGAAGGGEELRALRQENPVSSIIGEVGGAFLPIGAPALIGRAGRAVSAIGEGAGVAGKLGAAAAGGALEGGLFGAGQGVSELALSQDPLTVERVASTLSSSALYGAGFGAGLGGLGKAAELGLTRAKGAIDGALERSAAKAKTPAEAIESGDLELLDAKQLKAARDAELEVIRAGQRPEREAFVKEVRAARAAEQDAEPWRYSRGHPDPQIKGLGKEYLEADIQIRRLLKNEKGLAENPGRALDALQRQEQALDKLYDAASAESQQWTQDVTMGRARIRQELDVPSTSTEAWQAGERGPFTEAGKDAAVEREFERRFSERPSRLEATGEIGNALNRNRKLQQRLEALSKEPTSPRLTKIDDAFGVLSAPKVPSLGQAVLSAAAPFAGPLGVAAAAGNRVLGSFKKVAEAAGVASGKAVSTFLGPAIKATTYTPPLATKVLASLRFGAIAAADEERKREQAPKKTLPELYRARTDEVKQQIHIAIDGTYQMRPAARQQLAARFDGIRASDPHLADQLETAGAKRIEYLAMIMPRLPDYGTPQIGPERRVIPDLQMRAWARAAGALENPHAVLDRAAAGRVTPAEAAAIKAVYPELLADFTNSVAAQLPTLRKTLHRDKQLALSVLTGIPVDPAMTPGVQRVIQGMYASEPGTEGGTQAPRPEPQFGSVRADKGTQAQQRQGENA